MFFYNDFGVGSDVVDRSSGLGAATVQDLLAQNAYVSILDRSHPPEEFKSSSRVKSRGDEIVLFGPSSHWSFAVTGASGGVQAAKHPRRPPAGQLWRVLPGFKRPRAAVRRTPR